MVGLCSLLHDPSWRNAMSQFTIRKHVRENDIKTTTTKASLLSKAIRSKGLSRPGNFWEVWKFKKCFHQEDVSNLNDGKNCDFLTELKLSSIKLYFCKRQTCYYLPNLDFKKKSYMTTCYAFSSCCFVVYHFVKGWKIKTFQPATSRASLNSPNSMLLISSLASMKKSAPFQQTKKRRWLTNWRAGIWEWVYILCIQIYIYIRIWYVLNTYVYNMIHN